jgi:hypothetical protein
MFPKDECLLCGHTYEHHRSSLVAPCEVSGCECPDFEEDIRPIAYMGI